MRIFAATACAVLACAPAYGARTDISLSFGGDHRTAASVALAVDGGPTIDFVDTDPIPDRFGWKPVRYRFTAAGGATQITVSHGQSAAGKPGTGAWAFAMIALGLVGACLWCRTMYRRA